MIAIASALVAAGVMGVLFESTRWLGILCIAVLTFLFPVPLMTILLVAGVVFIFIHFFN
jgi:hypothetical protein